MPSLSEQIEGFELGHPDCILAGRQADDPTLETAKCMLPADMRDDVVDAYVVFAIRTLNMPVAPAAAIELSIDQTPEQFHQNKVRVVLIAEYDADDIAAGGGLAEPADELIPALQRAVPLVQAALNRGQPAQ